MNSCASYDFDGKRRGIQRGALCFAGGYILGYRPTVNRRLNAIKRCSLTALCLLITLFCTPMWPVFMLFQGVHSKYVSLFLLGTRDRS